MEVNIGQVKEIVKIVKDIVEEESGVNIYQLVCKGDLSDVCKEETLSVEAGDGVDTKE